MIIHLDLVCTVESTRWIHITINTDETEIRTDSRHKIWEEHLATDYYQHHGKKRIWTQDKRLLLSPIKKHLLVLFQAFYDSAIV